MTCPPNCLYFTAGVMQWRFETTTPVGITITPTERPLSIDKDSSVILIATAYTLWGHHILQNLSSLATQAKTHITFWMVQHRQFNSPQKDTAICHFLLAAHPSSLLLLYFHMFFDLKTKFFEYFSHYCVRHLRRQKRDWAQCKILRFISLKTLKEEYKWVNFTVTPCINNIKHFIVQLMHTNY